MIILITSPTFPPFNSGLGNAAFQQARAVTQAGHDVVVATHGDVRASETSRDGFRIERFPVTGAWSPLRRLSGDTDAYRHFLSGQSWDAVLLNAWQNWATDLALLNLGAIDGRKYVYSHCVSTNTFYARQPVRSLVRYLAWRPYWRQMSHWMKMLDGVIFLDSGGCDARFDDRVKAKALGTAAYVVPNSVSDDAVRKLEGEVRSLERREGFLAIGSYHWLKGFDFVLRAYAMSDARNRAPIRFFGQRFTAYTQKLRRLAERLGLDMSLVTFHEGVSGAELVCAYEASKVLLMGSVTECQPLSLIDACATGTPFLARATGAIDRMPGGSVVRTARQMADRMDALASDPVAWRRLSDAGRQAARDRYDPANNVRRLMGVLSGNQTVSAQPV